MPAKVPKPVFELVFTGGGIYPEKIPIAKVAEAFSAVRRLVTGEVLGEEDEAEDDGGTMLPVVSLLDVKRTSSAVFRFVGPPHVIAAERIAETYKVLKDPESIGVREYIIRPLKDLSGIASALGCAIVIRGHGKHDGVEARIESDSFAKISNSLFLSGNTSIWGTVQRVGGVTAMRCALRLPDNNRLLFCEVESLELARQLGDFLYQRVVASGRAQWLKSTMHLFSFAITGVSQPMQGSIEEHLKAVWEAGLNDWQQLTDPDAHLQEVRGNE